MHMTHPVPEPPHWSAAPERHVLLIVRDQDRRYAVANALLEAGHSLTLAASAALGRVLLESGAAFDGVLVEPSADPATAALLAQAACASPPVPVHLLPGEGTSLADVLAG